MIAAFVARHQRRPLTEGEVSEVLALMELGRNAQLMFTSCRPGPSTIPPASRPSQCLRYAARVCELAERVLGPGVEVAFVDALAAARSNRPEAGDGRMISGSARSRRPASISPTSPPTSWCTR